MEKQENENELTSNLQDDSELDCEKETAQKNKKSQVVSESDSEYELNENEPILVVRPSLWNYFWYLLFFFLIIPLIIALWLRASVKVSVYRDRVVVERGVLSKNTKEVFCADIRTIDVRQSFFQRIIGIGYIAVTTAGDFYEFEVHGIPNPLKLKDLLHERKRANLGSRK